MVTFADACDVQTGEPGRGVPLVTETGCWVPADDPRVREASIFPLEKKRTLVS